MTNQTPYGPPPNEIPGYGRPAPPRYEVAPPSPGAPPNFSAPPDFSAPPNIAAPPNMAAPPQNIAPPNTTPTSAPPPNGASGSAPSTTAPVGSPTPRNGQPPAAGLDERGRVKGSRLSALWVGVIVAAVLLILLLIFIAQNSRKVPIHFLGFSGHTSLAIALVLSAVIGVLLVAIPATGRILQLRSALRRNAQAVIHPGEVGKSKAHGRNPH